MKRLLIVASALLLFACGGGGGGGGGGDGGGTNAGENLSGNTGGNAGGDTGGSTGESTGGSTGGVTTNQGTTLTFSFPGKATGGTAQKTVAVPVDGFVRTGIRAVIATSVPETVQEPKTRMVVIGYDEFDIPIWEEQIVEGEFVEVPTGRNIYSQFRLSDGTTNSETGAATVSISVPPTTGSTKYTLFVFSWHQPAGSADRYLLDVVQSRPFSLIIGQSVNVSFLNGWVPGEAPPAIAPQLAFRETAVSTTAPTYLAGGNDYYIAALNKSAALRDHFYARPTDTSLGANWFIHEPSDGDVSGTSPLLMGKVPPQDPVDVAVGQTYEGVPLFVQAQFFIQDFLLIGAEAAANGYLNWTVNTTASQATIARDANIQF